MKYISRSKFNPFYILGYGLIKVLEALFIFLTLGFFTLDFSLKYTMWFAFREAEKKHNRIEHKKKLNTIIGKVLENPTEEMKQKLEAITEKKKYVRGNGDSMY